LQELRSGSFIPAAVFNALGAATIAEVNIPVRGP